MSKKLEKDVETFIERYKKARVLDIELSAIKSLISERAKEMSDEEFVKELEYNGIDITSFSRKKYTLKNPEATKEYLWEEGLLPLVVSIPAKVEKTLNVEKAIIEEKKSARIYSGANKIVDVTKEDFMENYKDLELDELSELFLTKYNSLKFAEKERDVSNQKLIETYEKEGIDFVRAEGVGNIRKTTSRTIDPTILFNTLEGKKELYIKKKGDVYEILIHPEKETAILPGTFKLKGKTIKEYLNEEELKESLYIKKSEFNKLTKEKGYKGFELLVEMDPKEFFLELNIQKSKIEELIEEGLLPEDFIEEHYESEEITDEEGNPQIVTIYLPEGVAEVRREFFLEKLERKRLSKFEIKRANKLSESRNENLIIDINEENFSF